MIVFDAEPIVAYAMDWAGSDTVEAYLRAVRNEQRTGAMNTVNLSEVHYVVAREASRADAERVVETVTELGVESVDSDDTFREVSRFKRTYGVSLGDAFALAAAATRDGTLLVGADDDFTEIETDPTEPEIERFRAEPD